MIQFLTLTIVNFKVIAAARVELANRGLVLVRGENEDTAAALSNGSGKTTIYEAFSWALFGQYVGVARPGADVVRNGSDQAIVTVEFSNGEHAYTITRKFAKKMVLEIAVDGVQSNPRTLADAQAFIEEVLSLDWNSFRNTVLYGQDDTSRFADPSATDADRKAVLKKILRLERFDEALAGVKERLKAERASHRRVSDDLVLSTGRLSVLNSQADSTLHSIKQWDAQNETAYNTAIRELRALQSQTPEEPWSDEKFEKMEILVQQVAERCSELDRLSIKRVGIQRRRDNLAGELRACSNLLANKKATLGELMEEEKKAPAAGICPTCGQEAVLGPALEQLTKQRNRLRQNIEAAELTSETLEEEIRAKTATVHEYEDALSELEAEMEELEQWPDKLEEVRAKVTKARQVQAKYLQFVPRIEALKARAKELSEAQNPHQEVINGLMAKIADEKDKHQLLRIQLVEREAVIRDLEFLEEAFSNKGLPSFVLDSVVPMIADNANRYLRILADGDLTVKIDTETELKSGTKEAIDFVFDVEGAGNVKPSGAQRKKIGLAIDLALMDLVASREGVRINILLLDEVLDGLDPEGRRRVVDLLKSLRETRETILVISHDPEVAGSFENEIVVKKTGKKSVVRG